MRPLIAGLAVLLWTLPQPAFTQTLFDRNAAYDCQRDVGRKLGPAPRNATRPGEDIVEAARRRQDYEDRYSRMMTRCLQDADARRFKRKPD